MRKILTALCMAIGTIGSSATVFAAEKPADAPLRAAIFIQNRAGAEFTGKLDLLNDLLTARLTGKGFSVIDRAVVLAKFREARGSDPSLQRDVNMLEKAFDGSNGTGDSENAFSGASALRIARMIGADYLLMASLTSFGKETRTFKGEGTHYGSDNRSYIYTLRITAKVLEGNQGGTVHGDTLSVSERVAVVQGLEMESTEVVNRLLDAGALKIAENIGDKVQKIRDAKGTASPVVEFSVKSNVEGATVELDGAAVGSTPGRFTAAPGLHQLRISRQWLTPWERTVNIFADQVLNVTLELSKEGIERYSTIEKLKLDLDKTKMQTGMEMKEREANIEVNRQKSDTGAFSGEGTPDGETKQRENGSNRIEVVPADGISK